MGVRASSDSSRHHSELRAIPLFSMASSGPPYSGIRCQPTRAWSELPRRWNMSKHPSSTTM